MTNATTITNLDELSLSTPTIISAETKVEVEGCHIVFVGNTKSCTAKGARWNLVESESKTPIRALVIG